jgi:hypothetical protein
MLVGCDRVLDSLVTMPQGIDKAFRDTAQVLRTGSDRMSLRKTYSERKAMIGSMRAARRAGK